jgi:HK97 family phage prohead protease
MNKYETMARRRDEEDAQRGYSIGGGGFVTEVDHRSVTTELIRRSDNPQVFEGLAVVYNKPHIYKGNVEVFVKGCFDRSLSTRSVVKFFIDHEHHTTPLGDTDSNLELVDTDIGLSFRLKLSPENLARLNGRKQMSVCYTERDVEVRSVNDENVRFIKAASLLEISACFNPAVKQTYAVVRDADTTSRLRDDASHFASGAAAAGFLRALRKLQ